MCIRDSITLADDADKLLVNDSVRAAYLGG